MLFVEAHRLGHDDRRRARDRDEPDLEVALLERARLVLRERPGRPDRKYRRERGAGGRNAHALDEGSTPLAATEHRELDGALGHLGEQSARVPLGSAHREHLH
jgi:hypothetical protein